MNLFQAQTDKGNVVDLAEEAVHDVGSFCKVRVKLYDAKYVGIFRDVA